MTRVSFHSSAGRLHLIADGHSLKNTSIDLCSAVSVLTETLEASVRLLAKQEAEVKKFDGYFEISTADSAPAQLLFASALLGLRALEKQYPDGLRVTAVD